MKRLLAGLACLMTSVAVASPSGGWTDVPRTLKRAGFVATAAPRQDCRGRAYTVKMSEGQLSAQSSVSPGSTGESLERLTFAGQRFQYEAKNRGEWGGELSVRSPDGTTRTLLRYNTRALLPVGEQLFVFTGLAHLDGDAGAVWVVENFDWTPRASKVTLLPAMPDVVSVDPVSGDFLMASSHAVMRLRGTRTLSVDAMYQFRIPAPNSVVFLRPYYVIGTCGALVVVYVPSWDDRVFESMTPIVTYYTKPKR